MKLSKIFLVLAVGNLCINCDGSLDLEPISEESTATAFSTPSQMEAALIGAYDAFGNGTENNFNEYYVWDYQNLQDVRSDNNYAGGDVSDLFALDRLDISTTNSRIENAWGALYNAIGKVNNVLDRAPLVEDVEFQAQRLDGLMAEAYFLRAYHYYQLVTLFSGVPLVLQPIKSLRQQDLNVFRSTSEEVYAQIIEDLGLALDHLPETYGSQAETKSRATSGAANALAAKAYLQKPNRTNEDLERALIHIVALEASAAGYRLLDNYDHLFDGNHENNAESIMEIQFNGGTEVSYRQQLLLPPAFTGDTWRKFMTPSQNLVNAFQTAGDNVRLTSSVFFESAPWEDEFWGNAIGSIIPFVYKWRFAGGWASDNNDYLLRYADIVLLKAEALNGLNRLPEAAIEVNRIRNRVGLPDLTNVETSSQEALKIAILSERRLELAFEGERWNDLVRNDEAISTMNNLIEINLETGETMNFNLTANELFLPIPQKEIDLNSNLMQGIM